jgi:hypothetical protein
MYYLHLYTDSYTPHGEMMEIDSTLLPRSGDLIEAMEGETFLVFDVTHHIGQGRCMVVVSAREAAREDRYHNFAENGYLDSREDPRHGRLFVSAEAWNAALSKLAPVRDIPY